MHGRGVRLVVGHAQEGRASSSQEVSGSQVCPRRCTAVANCWRAQELESDDGCCDLYPLGERCDLPPSGVYYDLPPSGAYYGLHPLGGY